MILCFGFIIHTSVTIFLADKMSQMSPKQSQIPVNK